MIITIDNKLPINIDDNNKDEDSIRGIITGFIKTNYDDLTKIKDLLKLLKSDIKNTVKVTGIDYKVNDKVFYQDNRKIKIHCSITGINGDGTYTLKFENNEILTNVKKEQLSPVDFEDDKCPVKNIEVGEKGIEEYCKKENGTYTGTTSNAISLLLHPDKNTQCIEKATQKFQLQNGYCEALKPTTGGSNKLDIVTSAIINSANKIIINEIKSLKI